MIEEQPTHVLLRTAYNALAARILTGVMADEAFADLRPAHGNAMEQLELEDGLRLTEMAARAGITVQSMGELVDDLETKGYLERQPDPGDRRAKRIYLTARGHDNARVAKQTIAGLEAHVADILGERRYAILRAALRDIIDVEGEKTSSRRVDGAADRSSKMPTHKPT